jgi:hypothetical protein
MSKPTLLALILMGCGASSSPVDPHEPHPYATMGEDASGTPGTLSFHVNCTRRACAPDVCCNSCSANVSFLNVGDNWRAAQPIIGHDCRADGCGTVGPCRVRPGAYTLPAGTRRIPRQGLWIPGISQSR